MTRKQARGPYHQLVELDKSVGDAGRHKIVREKENSQYSYMGKC